MSLILYVDQLALVGIRIATHVVLRQRGYDPVKFDPWYYPTADEYRDVRSIYPSRLRNTLLTATQLLEAAGFEVTEIGLHPQIVTLPGSLYDWLRLFVRENALGDFSDEEADQILKDIEKTCEPDCKDGRGRWYIMYVRLRVKAIRK